MIALILAAGEHLRWLMDTPKQLVEVGGEVLLERTMRQAGAYSEVIVVSHEPRIQAASGGRYFEPPNRRWLVETLLSSISLWDARTVVLLGDVIYTDAAMKRIMSYDGPLAVFGTEAEIFAVSFSEASRRQVQAVLTHCLVDAHKGGLGKLWTFYRAWFGQPLGDPYFEDQVFVRIEDGTNDIDTVEEYERLCPVSARSLRRSAALR